MSSERILRESQECTQRYCAGGFDGCRAAGRLRRSQAFAACSGYGCDGHDPNVQSWDSGPKTVAAQSVDGYAEVVLRWGKTDGDQYSWARVETTTTGGQFRLWVDRSLDGHQTWAVLGVTTKSISTNSNGYAPMYYNPSGAEMRACAKYNLGTVDGTTIWSDTGCTAWF